MSDPARYPLRKAFIRSDSVPLPGRTGKPQVRQRNAFQNNALPYLSYLVEQRLEEVVIVPVKDRDLDRRPRQLACGFEAAKPGAADHDARAIAPSSRGTRRAIR